MKGSKFLKVTGILMIIGGAIGIILGIIALLGVGALALLGASSGLLTVSAIFVLLSGVAELVAGIIGVKNCNNPDGAKKCLVWGVIVAVLSVVGNILGVAAGGSLDVFSLLIGLVLPALFIFGAVKNTQK